MTSGHREGTTSLFVSAIFLENQLTALRYQSELERAHTHTSMIESIIQTCTASHWKLKAIETKRSFSETSVNTWQTPNKTRVINWSTAWDKLTTNRYGEDYTTIQSARVTNQSYEPVESAIYQDKTISRVIGSSTQNHTTKLRIKTQETDKSFPLSESPTQATHN